MKCESSPNFEQLKLALFRKVPDRVPLAELQVDAEIKEAFLGKPVGDVATDVEFWTNAGYDYICLFPAKKLFEPLIASESSQTHSSVGSSGMINRKWPRGKGLISSLADLNNVPWPSSSEADYDMVKEARRHLPDGMGLICSVGGLWEYVWQMMGFERLCMALADEPELVDAVFQRVREIVTGVFDNLMDFDGIGAIWFCDDIAYTGGLMISPHVVKRYVFSVYKEMAKACHQRGLPVIYHSDGNLWQVMDVIIDTGIDALHPIEPKAMDIIELKQKVGQHLCLIGNVDLGYTLTRGSPEEVEQEVKQKIHALAPGGGYCLGSSNTITNYVPLENYRAMLRAGVIYGKYPILVDTRMSINRPSSSGAS